MVHRVATTSMLQFLKILLLANYLLVPTSAFHDCIEASASARRRRRAKILPTGVDEIRLSNKKNGFCKGGICIGMKNGPHQGGNSSYPVAWNGSNGTFVQSTMTVPAMPKHIDGITYYIWTDVFFGDASLGRMNQFVPQLLLGSALDSSSGPPNYTPTWHTHKTYVFGAHYFFETFDSDTNLTQAHAAYGDLYPTWPGESLFTTFSLSGGGDGMDTESPKWTLTMGVVGDDTRISKLVVERPYMGMGVDWDEPTVSWAESSFRNMCINSCWELYGASDPAHLPSSGSTFELLIKQPEPGLYDFISWERDEGNGKCPSCKVTEAHNKQFQNVKIEIDVAIPAMDTEPS